MAIQIFQQMRSLVKHRKSTEGEAVVAAIDVNCLHRRTGHASERILRQMASDKLVRGLEGGISGVMQGCDGCRLGKAHDKPHPQREPGAGEKVLLGRVSVDLARPFKPASIGGGIYDLVIVDECSRKSWV